MVGLQTRAKARDKKRREGGDQLTTYDRRADPPQGEEKERFDLIRAYSPASAHSFARCRRKEGLSS